MSELTIEILRKAKRVTRIHYDLCFDSKTRPGAGFSFPCTPDGDVLWEQIGDAGRANYNACVNGDVPVGESYVRRWVDRYTVPAVGLCEVCGEEVVLDRNTNTCQCGTDYNLSGQRLAPRSHWCEETWPESASDVVRGGL